MPKRYKTRRLAASKIRERIDKGRLEVIHKVGSKLLQIKTPDSPVTSHLYRTRSRRGKKMWLSPGSFLNSRWVPLGPRNREWELIETLPEQELKEKYLIVRVEENGKVRWYRLIYEVVSSRAQLLRQRVHIRAQYSRERRYKSVVLDGLEREFASHALGRAQLTRAQRDELSVLFGRISYRLSVSMTSIQARLAARDIVAFIDAWMEVEGLRGHFKRLSEIARNIGPEIRRPNFDVHLRNIADRLSVYISWEIRRPVRWARYHLNKAVDDVLVTNLEECRRHVVRATQHLQTALDVLHEWDRSLPEQERGHIPKM